MKTSHKILFGISALLVISSWVIAILYWNKLPSVIPIHFGVTGQANGWADKSVLSVYLMPFLQTLLLFGFAFLYYKPQYSDLPTTMWLMTLEKKNREHAFSLIRTMLVGVSVWIGSLFTYITFASNSAALDSKSGLSVGIVAGLIFGMILWLVYWTSKVYRATKATIASRKNKV